MVRPSPKSIRSRHQTAASVGAAMAIGLAATPAVSQTAVCWGRNLEGQCTVPPSAGSVQVIAGGLYHTVALRADGSVVCWGSSGEGQSTVPAGLGVATSVSAGHLHTLALLANGTVVAWGRSVEGQCAVPAGLSGVAAISAGWKHSVALRTDGSIAAWGSNTVGQLNVPATLGAASAIAAGGQHTLALRTTGTVAGWGAGSTNTGVNPNFGQSVPPAGLSSAVGIAAGTLHSAAVRSDGTVACWGLNSSGQCTVPPGLAGVSSIAAGNAHTLALRSDGAVVAWGTNASGQLTPPPGTGPASRLFAGGQHSGGIVASAPTVVVVSTTPATCALANGAIDVTVANAAAVAWSGPNGFTSSSTDLAGLAAGVYTVTASSPAGTAQASVTVPAAPDAIAPSIVQFLPSATRDADASCNGAAFDFRPTVVATDDCTAAAGLIVTQNPVAGTILGLGTHAITISVRDAAGNAATAVASFVVTGTARPFCTDLDQDGFGDPATIAAFCQEPEGGVANDGDCDDHDPQVNPLASEECDGEDDDCDHFIDEDQPQYTYYRDADGDGFGKTSEDIQSCQPLPPSGYSAVGGDCNDYRADVFPGAPETCANDGVDNDCDGESSNDAEAADATAYFPDADSDGYGAEGGVPVRSCTPVAGRVADSTDCNDASAAINPGATERCDAANTDEDCDDLADNADASALDSTRSDFYADTDNDGQGAGPAGRFCDQPAGYSDNNLDCNDGNPLIYDGAPERCNGISDDCDADIDEGLTFTLYYADIDLDTYGDENDPGTSACEPIAGKVTDNTDCNDANAAINPAGQELCDAANTDEDCDDLADNADASVLDSTRSDFYVDSDGDGQGAGPAARFCDQPAGYSDNSLDCDDLDKLIFDGAPERCNGADDDCDRQADEDIVFITYYADADLDTYGDENDPGESACAPIAGKVMDNTDCNDASAAINPGATERCDAANTDEDCDDLADNADASALDSTRSDFYADTDNDGQGAGPAGRFCDQPAGYSDNNLDCNDGNPLIYDGAPERCNGISDDCDADIDEGLTFTLYYADIDLDTYGDENDPGASACAPVAGKVTNNTDCNDASAAINPAGQEICDAENADEDCDDLADNADASALDSTRSDFYVDSDGDGQGAGPAGRFCDQPAGYSDNNLDCNDGNPLIYDGAPERCNGISDDCDADIDEGLTFTLYYADIDLDTYGDENDPGVSACAPVAGKVTNNTDCNDANGAINPGALELCDAENTDEDCDELADNADASALESTRSDFYADTDNDGQGAGPAVPFCDQPAGYSDNNLDCNDDEALIYDGAPERCNGISDDCDADIDEGLTFTLYYADIDLDTYGDENDPGVSACAPVAGKVTNNTDCDDANAAINPAGQEVCDAANTDEDCDGLADNDDTSALDSTRSDFYADTDHDGQGAGPAGRFCDKPAGYSDNNLDCNDGDPLIYDGADELCNAIDDDCDRTVDEAEDLVYKLYFIDADLDTYGDENDPGERACAPVSGKVTNNTDCNDADFAINPSAQEICDAADTDEDCNELADDADPGTDPATFSVFFADGDLDGYGAGAEIRRCDSTLPPRGDDCDDADALVYPGAAERCNGISDDCDADIDEGLTFTLYYADTDLDTYGDENDPGTSACAPVAGKVTNNTDCDDANAAINPAGQEVCDAANTDEDCDGLADNADASALESTKSPFYIDADHDGFGAEDAAAEPFCDLPPGYSTTANDCLDTDPTANPDGVETCENDGTDNDCNGDATSDRDAIDATRYYLDVDGDGFGDAADTGDLFCTQPENRSTNNMDCDDTQVLYTDGDGDHYGAGDPAFCGVPLSGDCDDGDPLRNPGAAERCGDLAVDNDCDGSTAEAEAIDRSPFYFDADADGFGSSSDPAHPPELACTAPAGFVANNGDGCPEDPAKQAPGVCGCGATDADANGNGEADCLDFVFTLEPSTEALGPGDTLVVALRSNFPTTPNAVAPIRAIGFQAAFGFDTAHLALADIQPAFDGPFPLELGQRIDNAAGTATFSASLSDFGNPAAGMTADAVIAYLTFTTVAPLPDCTALGLVSVLHDDGMAPPLPTRITTETAGGLLARTPVATPIGEIRIDGEAPVVTGVPESLSIPMDAGSDFGAFVAEPEILVSDNCEPEPSLVLQIAYPGGGGTASAWPADGMFPVGITQIAVQADDGAGNSTVVLRSIEVLPHYLYDLRLAFNSCIDQPTVRAIRIDGLPYGPVAAPLAVTFPAWVGATPGVAVIDGIEVPRDAAVGCISAKDATATLGGVDFPSHSITRVFGAPAIVDRRYVAEVTLFQGDSDDNDRIDIIDYGLFASDRGAGRATNARSNFNGDTLVNNADFGVFVTNFFLVGEGCRGGEALADAPLTRISLKELRRRGLGQLAAADLNGDAWLDLADVQLFIEGAANGAIQREERLP